MLFLFCCRRCCWEVGGVKVDDEKFIVFDDVEMETKKRERPL